MYRKSENLRFEIVYSIVLPYVEQRKIWNGCRTTNRHPYEVSKTLL